MYVYIFLKKRTETLNPRRLRVFSRRAQRSIIHARFNRKHLTAFEYRLYSSYQFFFFFCWTTRARTHRKLDFPFLFFIFFSPFHLHSWQLTEAHRLPFKRPAANGVRVQIDWTFPGKRLHHTAERLTSPRAALRLTERYLIRKELSGRGRTYPPGWV